MTPYIRQTSLALLCLVISLISTALQGQEKQYQSLLWEVSGNGMERPSYLYGTMHVSNKVAFHLGAPFFEALESVDQVATELEPEAWFDEVLNGDFMASAMRLGRSSGAFGSHSQWNEFQGRFAYPEHTNLKIQEIFKHDPQAMNSLLFRFYDPSGNFEEETWLDMFIYQAAMKLSKKTYGLETFKESMEMMQKAQIEMKNGDQRSTGLSFEERQEAQELIEIAYRNGDLDQLDSLSNLLNTKAFTKYILIERNKNFIVGMDSLMRQAPLFTGIGAAHLPGEEGCIEMLRELGYTVKPIAKGSRDSKRKDKLLNQELKRPLKTFTSADGSISFQSPFEGYEMTASSMSTSYLSMDIANGLTFSIDRFISNNSIQQRPNEYQMASIDSLLYELIPGEIRSQKEVNVSGYPAFDILHKTGRGSYNRSMIIVSQQEILIARLSGTGDKVKKGSGDHFFNSLKIKSKDQYAWEQFSDRQHSFSVAMNGKLTDYTQNKASVGNGDLYMQSVDADGDIFQVRRLEVSLENFIEADKYLLNKAELAYAKDYDAVELDQSYGRQNGRLVLDVNYGPNPKRRVTARYIMSANNIYTLHCYSNKESKAERFFSSFEIQASSYDEYYVLCDSAAYFSSKIPWKKNDSGFTRMVAFESMTLNKPEDMNSYFYELDITPPGNTDNLGLSYYRYAKYDYNDDKEDFVSQIDDFLSLDGDLIIHKKSYDWKAGGFVSEYVMSDSLSSKHIQFYNVFDGNRVLSVRHDYDSITGPSENYIEFIKHLELLEDTIKKENFFIHDHHLFLDDLQSSDSARFKMANSNLDVAYILKEEQQYEVFKMVNDSSSVLASTEDKETYESHYNALRYMDQSADMIALLKDEYHSQLDSALYQREILSTLAYMGTDEGMQAVKELILDEAPIGIYTSIHDIFFLSIQDSLELSAQLFPELLQLVDYEEYKEPILLTLSMMIDSIETSPEFYADKIPYLIRQAKLEYKRFTSNGHSFAYSFTDEDYGSEAVLGMPIYWNLLYPYRAEHVEIEELFEEARTSNQMDIRKSLALFYKNKGEELEKAWCMDMLQSDQLMESVDFLYQLDKLEWHVDTLDLKRWYVKDRVENQWRYEDYEWDESSVDSVQIMSVHSDSIRTHSFSTYYVKSLKTDDDKSTWRLDVVMINEASSAPNFKSLHRSTEVGEYKTDEEQWEELRNKLIANNRNWPFNVVSDYVDY